MTPERIIAEEANKVQIAFWQACHDAASPHWMKEAQRMEVAFERRFGEGWQKHKTVKYEDQYNGTHRPVCRTAR